MQKKGNGRGSVTAGPWNNCLPEGGGPMPEASFAKDAQSARLWWLPAMKGAGWW